MAYKNREDHNRWQRRKQRYMRMLARQARQYKEATTFDRLDIVALEWIERMDKTEREPLLRGSSSLASWDRAI